MKSLNTGYVKYNISQEKALLSVVAKHAFERCFFLFEINGINQNDTL